MPNRQIVLVDDEPYVTSVVSAKLQKMGDHVRVACDGQEAFGLASECVPDLIVSDLQMPILDGFELAKKLKSDPRTTGVPVILLTARGHLLTPSQLAETNIRQLIAKPFSTRELMSAIDELVPSVGAA